MSSGIHITSVHYPESDGKPMGETDEHRDEMIRHLDILRRFYKGQDVYVSGDLLLYYEQGDNKKFVVPDVFVVLGADRRRRRIYKLWVERKVPNIIIETTSRKTRKKDTDTKPALYQRLGVPEYFLFDPTRDYLDPPLCGYRLIRGRYRPIPPDAHAALISQQLGLRLQADRGQLNFFRRDTGRRLLTAEEAREREAKARQAAVRGRRAEAEARREETEARRAAEAEVARLREELRRLKGE